MWEPTSFKNRAQLAAAKRAAHEREKNARRKPIHIHRTEVELRLFTSPLAPPEHRTARLVLNDFTPIGVHLFSTQPMPIETRAALAMQAPISYFGRGIIVGCTDLGSHPRVISETAYRYRITFKFEYASRDEKTATEEFYARVREMVSPKKKTVQKFTGDEMAPPAHLAAWRKVA